MFSMPRYELLSASKAAKSFNMSHPTAKKYLIQSCELKKGLARLSKNIFILVKDPQTQFYSLVLEATKTNDFKRYPYMLTTAIRKMKKLELFDETPTKENLIHFLNLQYFQYLVKHNFLIEKDFLYSFNF